MMMKTFYEMFHFQNKTQDLYVTIVYKNHYGTILFIMMFEFYIFKTFFFNNKFLDASQFVLRLLVI